MFGCIFRASLTQYLFFLGLQYTSATFSCAFLNMTPVFTFLIAIPFRPRLASLVPHTCTHARTQTPTHTHMHIHMHTEKHLHSLWSLSEMCTQKNTSDLLDSAIKASTRQTYLRSDLIPSLRILWIQFGWSSEQFDYLKLHSLLTA